MPAPVADITVQGGTVGAIGDHANVRQEFHEHHHAAPREPVAFPVRVGRPPLLADAFQDRLALGEKIGPPWVVPQTLVLTGDGGVGKSQLAVRTWRHLTSAGEPDVGAEAGPDGGVDLAVWVTATSRTGIQSVYAAAAAVLQLTVGGDEESAAEAFLGWLESTGRSWLVVLDDLADPTDLLGLWPPGPGTAGPGTAGSVLVTTRRRDPVLFGHGRRRVDVGLFTPAEARQYLTERLERSPVPGVLDDSAGLDGLAADVGFLPIGLAQASAYVLAEKTTVAAYRELLADRRQRLAELMPADTGDEHERAVAATWSLAMDRANALPPEGIARRLALLIAVLDPHGIPESVLTGEPVRAFLRPVSAARRAIRRLFGGRRPGADLTVEQARRGLLNLDRFSIISHDPASPHRAVRMHGLAQRATREDPGLAIFSDPAGEAGRGNENGRGNADLAVVARVAADALLAAWPDVERDADLAQALRANVAALWAATGDSLWLPVSHLVLWRAGRSLGAAGLVQPSTAHWTAMVESSLRALGSDHPNTLTARHNLARWRGEGGDTDGAIAAYQELLTDRLRILGPDHPDTLRTRHNLARWQAEKGDAAGAVIAYQELLTDSLRILGSEHPDTLTTRNNLAYWSAESGDAAGTVAAYQELLTDRLRVLGPEHPDTLTARNNLAYWSAESGDAAGTVAAYQELLTDYLRVLGPEHPNTLTVRGNLADARGKAGDAAGAAAAFADLFTDYLRVLGPDHPDTLIARTNVGYWRDKAENGRPGRGE